MVANSMWDPEWQAAFSLADRAAVEDGRWWEGEPIWVAAERRGLVTASSFWPGSEAEIAGVRPTYWGRYDATAVDEARVDEALGWLDLPAAKRPRLDHALFRRAGRGRPRLRPGVAGDRERRWRTSTRMLARLRAGVAARGLEGSVDWIVVSDHGMTEVDAAAYDRARGLVAVADVAHRRPLGLRSAAAAAGHGGGGPRARSPTPIPTCTWRARARCPSGSTTAPTGASRDARRLGRRRLDDLRHPCRAASGRARRFPRGAHGYDPAERDMHGIFVAAGPSFRRGLATPPLDNVDVYPLLARLLGIPAAPNDGDPRATAGCSSSARPRAGTASLDRARSCPLGFWVTLFSWVNPGTRRQ